MSLDTGNPAGEEPATTEDQPTITAPAAGTPPVREEKPASKPTTPPRPAVVDEGAIRKAAIEEYNKKLLELTGAKSLDELEAQRLTEQGQWQKLAEQRAAETAEWRQKYTQSTARASILAAATEAGAIDPEIVYSLLADRATVTDSGIVKVGGKPPLDAVTDLLAAKKFLVKPTGNAGSGAPPTAKGSKKQFSELTLTEKTALWKSDPSEYQRLMAG